MIDYLLKQGILSETPVEKPACIEAEFNTIPRFEVSAPPKELRPFARHPDVWCYEHNRYQSPYSPELWIDASVYPTGFIATMGPLDGNDFEGAADTRPHFWQMVHETKCRVIVMTTDLMEGPKLKCSQYWPDEAEQYGDFLVEKTHERQEGDLHIRHLYVREHPVMHIHIAGWPDNGAYHSLEQVDWAVDATKEQRGDGPVVVHCSAGVGRTGSFISCYILKMAKQAGLHVNLPKLVQMLREEGRVKSVNDLVQYQMLYDFSKNLNN